MKNGPIRGAFWKVFISENCQYPAPNLLRDQMQYAEFTEFCECGCNSFGLRIDPGFVKPLLPASQPPIKGRFAVYTAGFKLSDHNTLTVTIFCNSDGHLCYIDVDCNSNNDPVPDEIATDQTPYQTWSNETLYYE